MPADDPWPAPAPKTVIPLSTSATRAKIILGTALLLFFGGAAAYGAISGDLVGVGQVAGRIISGCIAVLFLGLGGLMATLPTTVRSRWFTVDGWGIRYADPKGRGWECAWTELGRIRVETAFRPTRVGRRGRVRSILRPATPGFAERHPSLSGYAGRFGASAGEFGMPLGPDVSVAQQRDAAIRGVGAPCYAGMINTGMVIGPGGYV